MFGWVVNDEKEVEGSVMSYQGTIPAFAWIGWRKSQGTSVKMLSLQADIQTWDISNKKQEY